MEIDKIKAINAIEFAEWLSENKWIKRIKTHPNNIGKYWSDIHCEYRTIQELYEIFSKRKCNECTNHNIVLHRQMEGC